MAWRTRPAHDWPIRAPLARNARFLWPITIELGRGHSIGILLSVRSWVFPSTADEYSQLDRTDILQPAEPRSALLPDKYPKDVGGADPSCS